MNSETENDENYKIHNQVLNLNIKGHKPKQKSVNDIIILQPK